MLLRSAEALRIAYQHRMMPSLSLRLWVFHPMTRAYARLLGPCFKTGRRDNQLLHRGSVRALPRHQDQPREQVACDRPTDRPGNAAARLHLTAHLRAAKIRLPTRRFQARRRGLSAWFAGLHHTPQRTSPANALADRVPHTPRPPYGRSRHAAHSQLAEYGLVRWLYPFPSYRFHVLLNSLFKVLFNFPSRYLFAIGFVAVFSLR
jgi:hypothetical protein